MTTEDDTCIKEANKLGNLLELVYKCETTTVSCKNDMSAVIKHFKVKDIPDPLFKWLMKLMEKNMKKLYKRSQLGWKERKKLKEMTQETSRYLIAYINEKPIAFTHFQIDLDYGRQVLYCYEIQLETEVRGLGLGKHVMNILEAIATSTKLSLVVATIFKHNTNAVAFFKSIGYEIDETCPEEDEGKDYFIMSKRTYAE